MYEVIIGSITIHEKDRTHTELLPIEVGGYYTSWGALYDALKTNGIKNETFRFDKLCCEKGEFFFGRNDTGVKYRLLSHVDETCDKTYGKTEFTWYCPFCGAQIHFTRKNLGIFKLGSTKVQKEVCEAMYKQVKSPDESVSEC